MNLFVALLIAVTFGGQVETMTRSLPDGNVQMFKTKAECDVAVAGDMEELKKMLDGKVQAWEIQCITEKAYNKLLGKPDKPEA